ncbi:AAA family ATPase [Rhodobacteraceae bacterium F11138]|nr:AAA family ATPase [Rhodobacteraceae bacterium F11138]
MLTTIESVDALGVFDKYRKDASLGPFERFNVLYGMNGSGKTTLSRLFLSLNAGENESYPELKYTVSSSDGQFKQGQNFPRKVRVFNSDYVESNIGEIEGQLNPIFIVGEENKTLVSQIEADEAKLASLEAEQKLKEGEKSKLELARGKVFTDIAKIIASDTSGQVTRTYRKPEAEKAYAALKAAATLTDEELAVHSTTLRQSSLEKVPKLDIGKVSLDRDGAAIDVPVLEAIAELTITVQALCLRTSDSLAVKRLQENPDIAAWVEKGLSLHHDHKSETCEYCLQPIPQQRLEELAKHFNDSDRLLKEEIEVVIDVLASLRARIEALAYPARAQLYEELRDDLKGATATLKTSQKTALTHLDEALKSLKDKLVRRTEAVESGLSEYDSAPFVTSLGALNEVLDRHNKKTEDFEKHASDARAAIETHHLSAIGPDVTKYDTDIQALKDRLTVIADGDPSKGEHGISALRGSITANRAKVSNTAEAAERLSGLLQTFLGRDELKFEPEGDGYRIMRGSQAATRLSEGEKTAITFIYFIVQLEDQDFDITEGIVVIDDPISSLDSNSVYQAFSFLKNSVKDAKQVFLLTHNFDFLKLLLNWLNNIPKSKKQTSHYMLLCNIQADGTRTALIKPLDKELRQNESEYSWLFKQLYNFRSDGSIAGSYHIPNIARKVLEAFLDFYYPASETLYKKLERVEFDAIKKTALMKFANDLSHPTGKGFDPALVPETQKNVRYLLEMIETVSPIHFKSLKDSIEAV